MKARKFENGQALHISDTWTTSQELSDNGLDLSLTKETGEILSLFFGATLFVQYQTSLIWVHRNSVHGGFAFFQNIKGSELQLGFESFNDHVHLDFSIDENEFSIEAMFMNEVFYLEKIELNGVGFSVGLVYDMNEEILQLSAIEI